MDTPVSKPWHSAQFCNVAGALRWQAERQPGAIAVHYPDGWLPGHSRYSSRSYLELNELTDAYARGLQEYGIGPGMRTVLMIKPGFDFLAMFFALFKVGAVPVLIDPGMRAGWLRQCIRDAEPEAFVGSAKANLARLLLGWGRKSCRRAVNTGRIFPGLGIGLRKLYKLGMHDGREMLHLSKPDDMAAILFTSGGAGRPKGVVYRHRHLSAQIEMLKEAFDITPGELSLSTYPPFALFDPALGLTTVVPLMDPARPAKADPRRLVHTIIDFRVGNVFATPALLDTLGAYVEKSGVRLPLVRRFITVGSSVRLEVIKRLEEGLHDEARIHVAYGATECTPVSSISNHDVDRTLEEMMESGEGVCAGLPLEPNQVKIIAVSDNAFASMDEVTELPPGMPGEIIVSGPSCTDEYWRRDTDTLMARIVDDEGGAWHRTGDVGSIDGMGRLWYCGRVSQRIETGEETLYPDQAEAVFNQHPDVRRTALVGVGTLGRQIPVLCAELRTKLKPVDVERVHFDLLQLAQSYSLTRSVRTVLFHPGFPADVRRHTRIGREALASWAARRMRG